MINFDTTFVAPDDIEWFSVRELPFSVHGVFYSEKESLYRRLPKEIADAANGEIFDYLQAAERLQFSIDGSFVKNPSYMNIYIDYLGKQCIVPAGKTVKIENGAIL